LFTPPPPPPPPRAKGERGTDDGAWGRGKGGARAEPIGAVGHGAGGLPVHGVPRLVLLWARAPHPPHPLILRRTTPTPAIAVTRSCCPASTPLKESFQKP